jgi:hypothetical protein
MSFYFLTFLLLAAGTLCTWFRPQLEEKVYWVCWGVMTACLCFRFGQGTDYVTYHAIYETIPAAIDLSKGYICGFYPEVGWRLLSAAFKVIHAPFWVFTMVVGLMEMLLLHRYLTKCVQKKTAGLFLLYPVLFVTYMVSGLRQGLAVCIFLGVLVPLYLEKKWAKYVIGALAASSFHNVGYVWLILPAVYYLPMSMMMVFVGLSIAGGLVLQIGAVEQFLAGLLPFYHVQKLLLDGTISKFAVGERMVSFLILYVLYLWYKKEHETVEQKTEILLKGYLCSVCFYMLLCGNAYYASRYGAIFKVLEGAVVLALVPGKKWIPRCAAMFFFGLTLLMGCKNLNAMIQETSWYRDSGLQIWNFPYVSVFQPEKILEYIPYEKRLQKMYDYNIEDQQLWMLEE